MDYATQFGAALAKGIINMRQAVLLCFCACECEHNKCTCSVHMLFDILRNLCCAHLIGDLCTPSAQHMPAGAYPPVRVCVQLIS